MPPTVVLKDIMKLERSRQKDHPPDVCSGRLGQRPDRGFPGGVLIRGQRNGYKEEGHSHLWESGDA